MKLTAYRKYGEVLSITIGHRLTLSAAVFADSCIRQKRLGLNQSKFYLFASVKCNNIYNYNVYGIQTIKVINDAI